MHSLRHRVCAWVIAACASACWVLPVGAVNHAEFLRKVLAQDKLLEEAQIGLDIKQIELDASRDNYVNWKAELSASVSGTHNGSKQVHIKKKNGTVSTSAYTRKSTQTPGSIALNVGKRFLSNPASLTFSAKHQHDDVRNIRYKGSAYYDTQGVDGYTTTYDVEFKMPLLKHDGNAVSLKGYRRNIIDLQDQKLSFLETKEDFLHDRLADFLTWVLHQRQAGIHQELLHELNALQPQEESDEAFLDSVISRTESLKRDAETDAQAIKQRLSVLLDDPSILHATAEFDLQQRIILLRSGIPAYLNKNSRALQRITLDKKLNDIEVKYQRNRLLPSLDFSLRAEKEYDQIGTTTLHNDDDNTTYVASLDFSYPFGGATTKSELAKRALSTRRLEIAYDERLERIQADVQRLTALLTLDETLLLGAIEATGRSVLIERKNYREGRSPFRDLVQAHRDERGAKLEHIDNLITYHMNAIEYDNLLDRIIEAR